MLVALVRFSLTSNLGLLWGVRMSYYATGAELPPTLSASEERTQLERLYRSRDRAWRTVTPATIRSAAETIVAHVPAVEPDHELSLNAVDNPADTVLGIVREAARRTRAGRDRAAMGIENLSCLMRAHDSDCSLLVRVAAMASDAQNDAIMSAVREFYRLRNRFVTANLRLPISVARRYRTWQSFEERVQLGNLGLLKATHRFDIKHNVRFSTYGMWWIKHTIKRSADRIRRYDDAAVDVMTSTDDPESVAEQRERVAAIREAIAKLPELPRNALIRRYGLDGSGSHTLEETGKSLGTSREWARQNAARGEDFLRARLTRLYADRAGDLRA